MVSKIASRPSGDMTKTLASSRRISCCFSTLRPVMLLAFSMSFPWLWPGPYPWFPGCLSRSPLFLPFSYFHCKIALQTNHLGCLWYIQIQVLSFQWRFFRSQSSQTEQSLEDILKVALKKVLNDKKNIRKTEISCAQISDKQVQLLNGNLIDRGIPIGIE